MSTGSTPSARPPTGGWIWRPLVGAFLSQVVLGIVRPTISYAGLGLGADAMTIGLLAASFALVPIAVALPIGALAGRMRHIGVVPGLGALLLAVGCATAALSGSLPALMIASALLGVGNLAALIGAQAWISRSAPSARYNSGFGWMTAGMALGQTVGPLVAGSMVGAGVGGISLAFWLAACVGLMLAIVFASPACREYGAAAAQTRMHPGDILRVPGVPRYLLVSAAVLTSVDLLTAYLPVLGADAGIDPVVIGALLAVRGATSTLSRLVLGPLARRFRQSTLIIASTVGTASCLSVLSISPVPWVMLVALATGGFFLGIGQPLTMTAVAVALPAPARSSGLALRLMGNRIAQTATPLLAGASAVIGGIAAVFLLQVIVLVASAAWEGVAARHRADE